MSGLARFTRPAEWIFASGVLVWLARAHGPLRKLLRNDAFAYALLALAVGLLILHRRELRSLLAKCWPVLLPVIVAALSPLWSFDPQASLHAAVSLEAYTAFGLWLALRFDARDQQRLVAGTFALVISASALAALWFPEIGVMRESHPGAWRGLFAHKNSLGRGLGLGALACGLLAWAVPASRVWAGSVAALALAMLVPTRSVGSVVALVLAVIPVGLVVGLRRVAAPARFRVAIFAGAVLAAIAVLALITAPTWLALIGRDPTLTRRTEIWALLVPLLGEHPWLGYGPGAFWEFTADDLDFIRILGFQPNNAHNFFLDLALELGVVGLLAFSVPFAAASVRAVRLALTEAGAQSLWPLAFLTWCMTSGLVENAFLQRGPLAWAIFIAMAATLAQRQAALPRREPE